MKNNKNVRTQQDPFAEVEKNEILNKSFQKILTL